MKHLTLFVAAVLAVALAGCGGNGSDGNNTVPQENLSEPRIEAVVRVERSNLRNPNQYTDDELLNPQIVNPADLVVPSVYGVQDLSNFQTDEAYYFQLVAYSESGQRVILPASFSTEDVDFRHGVVGDSGLYLASDEKTPVPIDVFAEYNGVRYSTKYQLKERQVRVLGRVQTDNAAQTPLSNITVEFFDELGSLVGSVRTGYDGSFRASVPLSTRFVSVNSQLLPNQFYRSYVMSGLRYNAGDADCRTPIEFSALGTVEIDTIFVTPRVQGQPTPLPDGCQDPGAPN